MKYLLLTLLITSCSTTVIKTQMPHIDAVLMQSCKDPVYSGNNKLTVFINEVIHNNKEHQLCKAKLDILIETIKKLEEIK